MKIRCKNCYRVLNLDEEYCTRCGEHSEEIAYILKNGIVPYNPVKQFKKMLFLYLGIAFLLNAVFGIVMALVYVAKNTNIELGETGTVLPTAMKLFTSLNSLLISGLILFVIILILEWQKIKTEIREVDSKSFIISLVWGLLLICVFTFITKVTDISFIPPLFKEYILNPNKAFLSVEQFGLFKIVPVMIMYAFIEEYIFRKSLYEALDDATLMKSTQMMVIGTFSGVLLDFLWFGFFNSGSFTNILLILFSSFIIQYTMSIFYFVNKKNIVFNVIFRIVLYLLIVLVLAI